MGEKNIGKTITAPSTDGLTNLSETNGIVETTLFSNYDITNELPKEKKKYTSDSKAISEKIKYPQDFTDNISQNMVTKYMIGTPLEIITKLENKVIAGEKSCL